MALEIMKNIIEAERQADEIRQNAQKEAESIKSQAETKSFEILSQVKRNAKAEEKSLIEKAVEGTKDNVSQILKEADEKCNEIKYSAELKMAQAVEAVARKVVGEDGNS